MQKNKTINIKKTQIVVLVGGYGKRLGPLTKNTPKPLVVINNLPFIDHLINYLINQGFKNFLFIAGYKGIKIKHHLTKKNNKKNIKFDFYIEKKPMGTAYALKKAKKKIYQNFFLINGDTYTNLNYKKFLKKIDSNKKMNLCITKKKNKFSGNFYIQKNNIKFIEKPKKPSGLISCGIYYLSKKIINKINVENTSFEKNIIPYFIKFNDVHLIKEKIKIIDMGTPKGIKNLSLYL